MVRRILPFLAVLVLVLAGPVRGLFGARAPQACCCCGEAGGPGEDRGPCGMPKAPCAPQCPHAPAGQALQAPAAPASRVQTAQRRTTPEPRPWLADWTTAAIRANRIQVHPTQAAQVWPPPPWPGRDPQAGLHQFRI